MEKETHLCQEVFDRHKSKINGYLHSIRNNWKLDNTFVLECVTLFHTNFKRYYEDNDDKYLAFFFTSVKNHAKNCYQQKKKQMSHISAVESDGKMVDIFDIYQDSNTFLNKMMLDELMTELENQLEWYEMFIIEKRLENLSDLMIRKALNLSVTDFKDVTEEMQKKCKRIYGNAKF
jgi:DNA-directed RNA polymerase specialized sigma24 family protein